MDLTPSHIITDPENVEKFFEDPKTKNDTIISFVPGRDKTETDAIVVWGGRATENDLYKIMEKFNLPNLHHCTVALRPDFTHPSLKLATNDMKLKPHDLVCFNGCEINLTIQPEHIRQDRYRTIYSYNGDPFANTHFIQRVTEETQEKLSKKLTATKKGICPYCGSSKVQYTDIFHYDDEDKDEIEKKCFCEKCEKHFTEVYSGKYLYTEKE